MTNAETPPERVRVKIDPEAGIWGHLLKWVFSSIFGEIAKIQRQNCSSTLVLLTILAYNDAIPGLVIIDASNRCRTDGTGRI